MKKIGLVVILTVIGLYTMGLLHPDVDDMIQMRIDQFQSIFDRAQENLP